MIELFSIKFAACISFIMLASLVLWNFISSRGNLLVKVILIILVLWWGVAMYHFPNMDGHPRLGYPPNGSIVEVESVIIEEPKNPNDAAFIYLLVVDPNPKKFRLMKRLSPDKTFIVKEDNIPMLYKFKYTREVHERLQRAMDESSTTSGNLMLFHLKNKDEPYFKVLNPVEMEPKQPTN